MFRDYTVTQVRDGRTLTRFHLRVMLCLPTIQSDRTVRLCKSLIEGDVQASFNV